LKRLIVFIIATTLWAATASAQSMSRHDVFSNYHQVTWQERDGLPQNTVGAIATTRDGYLWIGTYEGAARFDGVRFTLFNPRTTTGIGNSFVTSLLERRDGDLWLATYGGGVSRLSGGRFTQYSARDGLSSDLGLCLFEDQQGTLWIGTDGGGVNAFSGGRFTSYSIAQGLPGDVVRAVVEDKNGGLLVGTNQGIARIAGGRVTPYAGRADVAHADVSTLARSPDGSLWVATMRGGLYRVDANSVTEFGAGHRWTNDHAVSLLADEDGGMWVGTTSQSLFHYAAGRFDNYTPADGLPSTRVLALARATDKGLWIGTDGGLVRFQQPRLTVYTHREGLSNDFAGSIFEDAHGSVWAETGFGLSRFANGAFKAMTTNDGLPGGRVNLALSADRVPLVYTNSGLARWTHDRFVPDNRIIPGIPWDRIRIVLEDRSGTLWLGIRNGGLIRVRDGHTTQLGAKDGLTDDAVNALFEDPQGSLWVGTLRSGVTRISNGQMTSWSTRDGLAANHVKAFYQDAAGTMWIGTHGGGLSRFKDGRFATISARQGLYNDDIFQILEDDDGNLWMNCNTGIWRTSVKQLNDVADGRRTAVESFAYGTADGMLSSEGVGANFAGWKMRDGSLWFPTIKGIVAIDVRRRAAEPPRVVIEGITIDREPIATGGAVRLTPGQENVEIRYTGLSWNRPQAIRFKYRLVGLDRDWVDAGARRTAYYSHLPAGSYTFNVTADNGEGAWNASGMSLAIVVLPRFYQSGWFRTAVASSLVALVWLSWRYRVAQMRRAHDVQQAFSRQLIESQERERQRIAAELHDSLGQNLLVVRNRALLAALSQQDDKARQQFDDIGATVAQTLEEVRTISYRLRPHHLDQLGLTTTIRATVETMTESSGIGMTSDLDDIDGVFTPADDINIYRIIQECLTNVVKHSQASEAQVAVHCHEHRVDITIRDNGQGFAARPANAGAADRGGFGLKGLAERVHMLGGTYTIESAPGRGTTVTVRVRGGRQEPGHGE
jgi:signal transduction histidine kinase/ligand-binding sensor domain-containing protein